MKYVIKGMTSKDNESVMEFSMQNAAIGAVNGVVLSGEIVAGTGKGRKSNILFISKEGIRPIIDKNSMLGFEVDGSGVNVLPPVYAERVYVR